jgi:hypothetical protein
MGARDDDHHTRTKNGGWIVTAWRKVQGDVNDTITVVLSGVENLLTATAVEAHVWRADVAPETLPAAITDPVTRTVLVQLGGASGWLSDAAANVWYVDVQVTFADGSVFTWPSGGPDTIAVRDDM